MPNNNWGGANKKYKSNRPKFHLSILFLLIIVIFLLCFILYMITSQNNGISSLTVLSSDTSVQDVSEEVTAATTTTTVATTTVSSPVNVNPVPENSPKNFSYFNDCVFIGDSLTVGLSSYGIIPEKNVLANTGLNIDKINDAKIKTETGEIALLDELKAVNPKNVYIMLGSNGIAWLSNEHMTEKYGEFIDKIKAQHPDLTIYILSIPPVSVNKETLTEGSIQNTAIDSYNSELLKLADAKKVNFVDINTALKGNDGKLPVDSAGKDGMHFKKDTYTIMLNYILQHTVKE